MKVLNLAKGYICFIRSNLTKYYTERACLALHVCSRFVGSLVSSHGDCNTHLTGLTSLIDYSNDLGASTSRESDQKGYCPAVESLKERTHFTLVFATQGSCSKTCQVYFVQLESNLFLSKRGNKIYILII